MPKRVLCAGETDDICFILTTALRGEGYEVREARSAGEVLALSARERFDLYVLDGDLSGGAGVALCAELRRREPSTPVVIYSGVAFESDRKEALRAGASRYVPKPEVNKLIEAVRLLLNEGP